MAGLIDNIYAYYKLDEASGSALDATGNGRSLTNQGNAIGTAAGIINTARDFGGVSGSTLSRNQNTVDFFCGANPFTFSFWVRFDTFPAFNDVGLCNRYEPFGQREYIVFLRQSDKKFVFNIDSGAGGVEAVWATAAVLNTWYYVAGGWDGTNIKLSVNAGNFVTTPWSTPMVNGGDNFKLGYEAATLDGRMDEFGFWIGRSLTLTEVTQIYNGGNGLDFSQYGTIVPSPQTFNSDGSDNVVGNPNCVQALHDAAACHDGDTITIPTGTFTWNTGIAITKAITIQGNTTVTGDHVSFAAGVYPTNKPVVNDLTNLIDNVTGGTFINASNNTATGTLRFTGLTLRGGVRISNPTFGVQLGGTSKKIRVDHVHTFHMNRPWTWGIFCSGVIDHFFCEPISQTQEFEVRNRVGVSGDEEFATPGSAYYGTDDLWYIEDSYIDNTIGPVNAAGGSDRNNGGRVSWRYCFLHNAEIVDHGTYSGRRRGGRMGEDYNNVYQWDPGVGGMDGITSGSIVYHGNRFRGTKTTGWNQRDYRCISNEDNSWGGAGGQNPWDVNATRIDGTHHDGEPPFRFETGTITAWVHVGTQGSQTLTDNTKAWTANQWAGYSVVSPDGTGITQTIAIILSNNANTLTMYWYSLGQNTFTVGNGYGIYKTLQALDQPGVGQGPLISPLQPPTPPTGFTGAQQVIEPSYAWDNIYEPDGTSIGIGAITDSQHIIIQGVHIKNNTVKPGYTPLVYPHPLVGGAPVITKIISLSGAGLAFGNVTVGGTPPTATLTVANQGNTLLTVTAVSYPTGFSGSTAGFTVAAGGSFDRIVTFTPLLPQAYGGNIVVSSDATSGIGSIACSGTGVNPAPVVPGHRKYVSDTFGF